MASFMNRREVKRAPVLRFKGFTNDWEQRKLIEILKSPVTDGPHETPQILKKGVPFISVEAIVNNKIDFNRKRGYISFSYNAQCNKKYRPQKKDVLLVKSGSTVGKVAVVETNTIFNIWSPLAALRVTNSNDPYFLYYLLQTNTLQRQIINKSKGGTQPNLSMRILEQFKIFLPQNYLNQQKIEQLLRTLDKCISLQQRKLELLKASKKAVLQNIFTDTKRVPTIRFNTFSENWNQKRLKPFLIKYNKKTTVNNQYPVLTSSRQGLFFQKDYYDGNQIASKNNIGYNIVPRNYFTYRHMSDDLIFHFNINTICDYGIVSTLYPVFTTTSEIDSQWLLYYLNHSVDIKKYALLQKQGGSRTYMYFSKLESLKAHIPALAEQKKISSLIFKIDEQIYFQQKKLKYLQKFKRFLLQNMFI